MPQQDDLTLVLRYTGATKLHPVHRYEFRGAIRLMRGAIQTVAAKEQQSERRNVPQLDQRDRLDFARGSVSVVPRGGMCVASS